MGDGGFGGGVLLFVCAGVRAKLPHAKAMAIVYTATRDKVVLFNNWHIFSTRMQYGMLAFDSNRNRALGKARAITRSNAPLLDSRTECELG